MLSQLGDTHLVWSQFSSIFLFLSFLLAAVFKLSNHLLFHLVNVELLLFETLGSQINVLLQVHELFHVQVAVFRLLVELRFSILHAFPAGLKLLLQPFPLLYFIIRVIGSITLLLEHGVNHF